MNFDSFELRLLLGKHIGGRGQCDENSGNPNKLYLPLAGSSCRIGLTFRDKKIVAMEPGPAFDASEWNRVSEVITRSILCGAIKVGREYSFSGFRVEGCWRGERSGVQILPPPPEAPRAPVEMAEHPFILEFPVTAADFWPLTNHRRIREHRNLTLLLNVLLAGGASLQPRRPRQFWGDISHPGDQPEIRWVQEFFPASPGDAISDELSPSTGSQIEAVKPQLYYVETGCDGKGLRIPSDLDESICLYKQLSAANRAKFDRAIFWMDMAAREWSISVSSSFTALASAVEALTDRGTMHVVFCEHCKKQRQHEVPGANERFRTFFDTFAPGASLEKNRNKMYSLRSGILHGGDLMRIDQDLAFGWDPPGRNEGKLHGELWGLSKVALRNWLRNPGRPGQ